MTYIENIFICLAIPLLLTIPFRKGSSRRFTMFTIIGMGICLLSAYVNSFFMGIRGIDALQATVEITPVCEEVMKLLPLLFYFLIFEPEYEKLPETAIAIAVGFATFENVCYLTEHGAENFLYLLIRGISAGALHVLCGTFCGLSISYVFRRNWLALTGTIGIFGACVCFHALYNLLITGSIYFKIIGYLFPSLFLAGLFALRRIFRNMNIVIK